MDGGTVSPQRSYMPKRDAAVKRHVGNGEHAREKRVSAAARLHLKVTDFLLEEGKVTLQPCEFGLQHLRDTRQCPFLGDQGSRLAGPLLLQGLQAAWQIRRRGRRGAGARHEGTEREKRHHRRSSGAGVWRPPTG